MASNKRKVKHIGILLLAYIKKNIWFFWLCSVLCFMIFGQYMAAKQMRALELDSVVDEKFWCYQRMLNDHFYRHICFEVEILTDIRIAFKDGANLNERFRDYKYIYNPSKPKRPD